jgi:hypothetical protein
VRPYLTIAIPTFERAPRLAALLERLVEELSGRDDVDVLVADNASSDGTQAVLAAAAGRLPLRIQRHDANIGPLENVRWLLINAGAEYVWCFGDDDLPEPGGVAAVLDLLRRYEPVWLHVPHRWIDDAGRVVNGSPVPVADEVFADSGDLFRRYNQWLTFLSASIVRGEEAAEAARGHPTENRYSPLVWFFRAARHGRCVVPAQLLVTGSAEIGWGELRTAILTEHFVGLYDEAVGLELASDEFGLALDDLYETSPEFFELWRAAPLRLLEETVRRFPTSRALRRFLWLIAREQARPELIAAVALAVEVSGAGAQAAALVEQGEQAFGGGDAAAGLELFQQAVATAPTSAQAWTDVGVARHALALPGVLDAFDAALDNAPGDVGALLNRARVLIESGRVERGAEDVRAALVVAPADPEVAALAAQLGLQI